MKYFTRRDFLKTSAIGSAGIAALLLAGCSGNEEGKAPDNQGTASSAADANKGASGEAGGNNINESGAFDKDAEAALNSYHLDTIRIHYGEITTVTPTTIKNASTGIWYSLYEMLFQNDDNMGGVMYPVLADPSKGSAGVGGYDHEPGSSDYTVYIYDNIYDTAGNHITAEDVKFSFAKTFEAGETSGWDSALPENIEVVDDYTLTWHCDRELDKLGELENIWCRSFVFSQKAYEASSTSFASDACGTGHYVLSELTSGSRVVLTEKEEYWQAPELQQQIQMANVHEIQYIQLTEAAQAVIALENDTLDYSQELKADNLVDFLPGGSFADKFNTYSYLGNMTATLMPNCDESAITGDINLRKAIFWAIDTNALCKMLGETTYSPVPFIATSYFKDYDADWEALENYNTKTDLAKAKEFLDKSKYNGETIRLVCNGNQSSLAEIIQGMLLEAGIKMEIQALDRANSKTVLADPTKWELNINITAGDFIPTLWSHNHDFSNTPEGDHSFNFVYDAKWQELLNNSATAAGHTKEGLTEYVEYSIENAYGMGLYAEYKYCLYPKFMTTLCFNDKLYIVPGGCVYEDPNA